jgi:hypothetical protein
MIARRLILAVLFLGLAAAAGVLSLNPAASTVDVTAETDIVEFETFSFVRNQPSFVQLGSASVCILKDDGKSEAGAGDCKGQLQPAFENQFSGKVELRDSVKVVLRRLRLGELDLSLTSNADEGSIVFHPLTGADISTRFATIKLTKSFFEAGNIFSAAAAARKLVIGSDGRTFGNHRGLFLLNGLAFPLSKTVFGNDVVRGTPIPLSAGSTINFESGADATEFATLFVRAEPTSAIRVGTHFPNREAIVRSFAGSGIPISVSWLERLKSDPILIVLLSLIGLLISIPDWLEKLDKVRSLVSGKHKRGRKRTNAVLLFIFPAVLTFLSPTTSHSQSVFVRGLFDGQGYLFRSEGHCYVVTALHVVQTPDGQSTSSNLHIEFGNVQYDAPVNPPSTLPPNWIKQWRYPPLDIALVEVPQDSLCTQIPRQRLNEMPPQDQLIFARGTGAIEYIPIEITNSNGRRILVKEARCILNQGRSGSLAISKGGKILGFLVSTDNCSGMVTPVEAINSAFRAQARVGLPVHARADELVESAFQADERSFFVLLNIIDDPNTVDGSGQLPLSAVATAKEPSSLVANQANCISRMNSRLRIAGEILRRGGRIDGKGGESFTPLISAVWDEDSQCSNASMIEFLLKNGASANQIYRNENIFRTVLHYAVAHGSVESLTLLLQYGADANVRDSDGNTPIMKLIASDPTGLGAGIDSSCSNSDNNFVKKFKVLAPRSDLNLQTPESRLTTKQALQRTTSAATSPGQQRCFQRMLQAIGG